MPLTLHHPGFLLLSLPLLALTLALVWLRQPRPSRPAFYLLIAGLACFAFAAASPSARLPVAPRIAVLVDLSPSTRTAVYRERAQLDRRLGQLLPGRSYHLQAFADSVAPLPTASYLPDLPAEQTRYLPPADADVVLLFTDARVEAPDTAPPTFIIADPALTQPQDAAVVDLQRLADTAIATVRNTTAPRSLTWSGAAATDAPIGDTYLSHVVAPDAPITARLAPADAWPENDALSLPAPPPRRHERWWISTRQPPADDWRWLAPRELPHDPLDYLAPAVVVLDNIAADDLPASHRLLQYVRDLGGAIVLLGGDRAFAAGGYDGTPIDALSPLAASPPAPRRHWLILIDASGSMATAVDAAATRWSSATAALRRALAVLPPHDRVSVGGFADAVDWWLTDHPVAGAQRQPLPPTTAQPRGATNLQHALEQIARSAPQPLPRDLLLLTDAQATLDAPGQLAEAMQAANIRLHVLLTADGPAADALAAIARDTRGQLRRSAVPEDWAAHTAALARDAAAAVAFEHQPLQVQLDDPAAPLPAPSIDAWNRTWLKPAARRLAHAMQDQRAIPMIAHWRLGNGQVLAAAFSPAATDARSLADHVALPPADPRFQVDLQPGPVVRLTVHAADEARPLNDLSLQARLLTIDTGHTTSMHLTQVAPGRYELTFPAPRRPALLTVLHNDAPLQQHPLPDHYGSEFAGIGFDADRADELARNTGGAVIPPDHAAPLDLPMRWESRNLTSPLAAAGALLVGLALLLSRRAPHRVEL